MKKIPNKIDRLFAVAKRQARRSSCNYRLGAVVAKKKILASAHNTEKTHTLTNLDPYAEKLKGVHAELGACLKVSRNQLEGADLFVCRILRDGSWAMAKPCPICEDIMSRFGIKRIFYTIGEDEYGVLTFSHK